MKIALTIPGANGTPIKLDSNPPAGVPTGGLFDDSGFSTGQRLLQGTFILIIVFAILVSLWFMVKGGLDIIMSHGEKEKLKSGKDRVFFSFFGLLMIFISIVMINIIGSAFGYDFLCLLLHASSTCK